MLISYRIFSILSCCLLLGGCVSSYYIENPAQEIVGSPYIKLISNKDYQPRTKSEIIKLYYKHWNSLTRPDAVKNWKYLFVIDEASSPEWEYTELSEVVIAQQQRDDSKAINELRYIAYKQGGDGIINLHREPMINAPKFGSKITGFRYYGIIVRSK